MTCARAFQDQPGREWSLMLAPQRPMDGDGDPEAATSLTSSLTQPLLKSKSRPHCPHYGTGSPLGPALPRPPAAETSLSSSLPQSVHLPHSHPS